jgi:hypothetical protein
MPRAGRAESAWRGCEQGGAPEETHQWRLCRRAAGVGGDVGEASCVDGRGVCAMDGGEERATWNAVHAGGSPTGATVEPMATGVGAVVPMEAQGKREARAAMTAAGSAQRAHE